VLLGWRPRSLVALAAPSRRSQREASISRTISVTCVLPSSFGVGAEGVAELLDDRDSV
jgi:hypothetical protein